MRNLVRFALVLIAVILLQRSFIYEIRSILRSDMQFSASLSMEINSDIARLPAVKSEIMLSDVAKLHFEEFPTGPLEYHQWFQDSLRTTQDYQGRVRNAANEIETYSLQLPFLMGMHWNIDELIWPANKAAMTKLTADAILEHTSNMPLDEQELLHEDEVLMIFNHALTHRKAQISLRRAILSAFPDGHPLNYAVHGINKGIGAADLYQGSRLLLGVRTIISKFLSKDRPKLSTAALKISRELVENSDASSTQLHDSIFLLEKYVGVLFLAGQVDAEQEYVSDFIEQMLQHTTPAILDSVKAAALGFATHAPYSLASLRASILHHLPIHSASDNLASTASSPALGSVEPPSLAQEQTVPAIPQLKSQIFPGENEHPTTMIRNRFSPILLYLVLLTDLIFCIYLGVDPLGVEPVVLGLINSFSTAWVQCASVASESVVGLGLPTKRDFFTRCVFLFLAFYFANLAFDDGGDNDPADVFRPNGGQTAFYTASSTVSGRVNPLSQVEEQASITTTPGIIVTMHCFRSTILFIDIFVLLYVGLAWTSVKQRVRDCLHSISLEWFQHVSLPSMSFPGLSTRMKHDFLTCVVLLISTISLHTVTFYPPIAQDHATMLHNVLGHVSSYDNVGLVHPIRFVSQDETSITALSWCQDGGAHCHVAPTLIDWTANYQLPHYSITVTKAGVINVAIGFGDCYIHTRDNMVCQHKTILCNVLDVSTAQQHLIPDSCMALQNYQVIYPGLFLPKSKVPADFLHCFIPTQTVSRLRVTSSQNCVLAQATSISTSVILCHFAVPEPMTLQEVSPQHASNNAPERRTSEFIIIKGAVNDLKSAVFFVPGCFDEYFSCHPSVAASAHDFLHSLLTYVHSYVHFPARSPYPHGNVLKMLQLVYAFHLAPLHFKQEVSQWLRSQAYVPVHVDGRVWHEQIPAPVPSTHSAELMVHAIYSLPEIWYFVLAPGQNNIAGKRLHQCFKRIQKVELKDSSSCTQGPTVQLNQLCGFVDSDWIGVEDTSSNYLSHNFSVHWSEYSVGESYSDKPIDLHQNLVHGTVQDKTFHLEVVPTIDSMSDILPQILFQNSRMRLRAM